MLESDRPTWQLVLTAARVLGDATGDFRLKQLVEAVQKVDPKRGRASIQPVIQGMTLNAGNGPSSPCGRPLIRVEHGVYRLVGVGADAKPLSARSAGLYPKVRTHSSRERRSQEIESRIDGLISEFASCVEVFDQQAPFTRRGQYTMHRKTIDQRRTFSSVQAALQDDEFLDDLYQTLQAWGLGKRGSKLVPRAEFGEALRRRGSEISSLENLRLEDLDLDAATLGSQLWELIERLNIVLNKSLVVPGAKTLHHLLPDLLPPMDRAWTGSFFLWSATAPQSDQRETFVRTFSRYATIARAAKPSTYVGAGWRTCSTKILDNAIIGYCKLHGITPPIYVKTVAPALLAEEPKLVANEAFSVPEREPVSKSISEVTPLTPTNTQQIEIESLNRGHIEFDENETGISYDYLFGPYVKNARMVMVVDPYIRNFAQARNMLEFIETVRKVNPETSTVAVSLVTISDEESEKAARQLFFLSQVESAAASMGILFSFEFDKTRTIHDREVLVDLNWKIVLGRGLDIFQPPPTSFFKTNVAQTARKLRKFNVTYVKDPLARRMSNQRK